MLNFQINRRIETVEIELIIPECVFCKFEQIYDDQKYQKLCKKYDKLQFSKTFCLENVRIEDFPKKLKNLMYIFDEKNEKYLIFGKSLLNCKGKLIKYIVEIEENESGSKTLNYEIKTKAKKTPIAQDLINAVHLYLETQIFKKFCEN